MSMEYDEAERTEMLRAFSEPALGQDIVPVGGKSLPSLEITDGVVTARRCEVRRDEGGILQRITALAAWAGTEWFYSWEVNDRRRGRKVTVEGLSIDGADALARLWGNCMVDCRVVDAGDAFVLYGKFVDYETGYTLIRPFMQNKAASKMQTEDELRKRDMALAMGVSKCERNVVVHALKFFAEHALREAKKNLVERVGKDLNGFKQRIADKLAELEVGLDRVERIVGRPLDKWTVQDTAKIYAEVRTVADNMARPEDVWPLAPPPEPRRTEVPADEKPAAADQPAAGAAAASTPPDQPAASPRAAGGSEPPQSADTTVPPERRNWRIDVLGQDAFLKAFENLLDMVDTDIEQDELEAQNRERLGKVTGLKRTQIDAKLADKRRERAAKS